MTDGGESREVSITGYTFIEKLLGGRHPDGQMDRHDNNIRHLSV
jgi:hypothetical protein